MSEPGTSPQRGAFITIEGPEGGGKTTVADRLRAHLEAAGRRVILTREPGGTWLGERLRDVLLSRTATGAAPSDPLTDALLFNAARRRLVEEVIAPALDAGTSVICARFADSTLAYQGYGSGVPLNELRALATLATGGLEPDLTLVLDVPVEIGLARKSPGDVTRFEAEFDLAFHGRVRDGFLALATDAPERFVVVDASQSLRLVTDAVAAAVDARLGILPGSSEPSPADVRIIR